MRLVAFGDSLTAGGGILGTGPSYYPYLTALLKGASLSVLAVSGAMAADQRGPIYSYAPVSGDVITYMIGVNDQRIYGVNSSKLANYETMLAAETYFLASQTQNAQSWTQTGTWATNAPYTTGVVSSTSGSTLTATFTGDLLTFGYIIQDGGTGSFSVTVDGVAKGTFNTASAAAISTQNGVSYGPALGRITGNGAGSHTVVCTVLSNAQVYLDWIGTGAGSRGFSVFLSSITRMTTAGYTANGGTDANVTSYNTAISSLVTQVRGDGFTNVSFVDAGAAVNPATDIGSDLLHPNAQGQVNLTAVVSAAV